MPHLDDLAADEAERGIVVLALNLEESLGTVQSFQNDNPNILFLMDTDSSVYGAYRQNGYIPLNYTIGPDMAQTVDYWGEGFNEAALWASVVGLRSPVSANLTPDFDTYPQGGTLGFDIAVRNWTLLSRELYLVVDAVLPSGGSHRIGITRLDLGPGEEQLLRRDLPIPGTAALGDYTLRVRLGQPPADLWNADTFDFEITP